MLLTNTVQIMNDDATHAKMLQNYYSDFYLLDGRDFTELEGVSVLVVDILYSWQQQNCETEAIYLSKHPYLETYER